MNNKKIITIRENTRVMALAPTVVSASWHTDIPAFYSEWFFRRLAEGYLIWRNPRDGHNHYVCFDNTRFFVLWSKNPAPLLDHKEWLTSPDHGSYLHFTLNDYAADGLEPNLAPLSYRIRIFKELSEIMGPERILWRYDPIVLTDTIDIDTHLERIANIGRQLKGYTERLIFSFVDIARYKRVVRNIAKYGIRPVDWSARLMQEFARRLSELNDAELGFRLATCAEICDLESYGIAHNRCVDGELMKRLRPGDGELAEFVDAVKRASWQRPGCGCIPAKDIGRYNCCPHGCQYCYATESYESALRNYQRHDPDSLMLIPPAPVQVTKPPKFSLSDTPFRPAPTLDSEPLFDPTWFEFRHTDIPY